MTDETESQRTTSNAARTARWPLSNYPLVASIVCLFGTAAALTLSTNAAADRLATAAIAALALGVAIRLVEAAVGPRRGTVRDALRSRIDALRARRDRQE